MTTKPFASCAVASISSCYYGSHAWEAQGQGPQRNAVQFADRRRAPHRQPGGKQASHPFLSVVCTCTVRSFSFLRRGKIIPAITLAGFVFFQLQKRISHSNWWEDRWCTLFLVFCPKIHHFCDSLLKRPMLINNTTHELSSLFFSFVCTMQDWSTRIAVHQCSGSCCPWLVVEQEIRA